ncbi:MAG: IS110 family transposase [Actinobacteria bacterium]|nr:IS110 family transposase [Actinomycetota bacterium]
MYDATTTEETKVTVGLDLGDRYCQVCVLDEAGEVTEEGRVATKPEALRRRFSGADPVRIVLECGTHSPWISRLLAECGHDVIVANPRKLRLIYQNDSKSDRVDAEYLARVGRLDPALLAPLTHRGAETQADLALVRSRLSEHTTDAAGCRSRMIEPDQRPTRPNRRRRTRDEEAHRWSRNRAGYLGR